MFLFYFKRFSSGEIQNDIYDKAEGEYIIIVS